MLDGEFGEWLWHPAPRINIDKCLCPNIAATTLLHESIHGISDMHGLDLTEAQVRTLEVEVSNLMRYNPKLANMLTNPEG